MPPSLTQNEARVLGCLLEKAVLTPEVYPLTLNSLRSACNQKTSREPVLDLEEAAVSAALNSLKGRDLVFTRTDARATKYNHTLEKLAAFSEPQRALITLLLLRGPQTAGELRGRAERLHAFASPAEAEQGLESLAAWPEGPWVRRLARRPGEKEARWAHLLCGDPAPLAEAATDAAAEWEPPERVVDELRRRLDSLEAEVARLKLQLEDRPRRP